MTTVSHPSPRPSASDAARHECSEFAVDTQALAEGRLSVALYCQRVRQRSALREALPPAFDTVLTGLLDRLESAALFTEESCSFSQRDLIDNLRVWHSKATSRLAI